MFICLILNTHTQTPGQFSQGKQPQKMLRMCIVALTHYFPWSTPNKSILIIQGKQKKKKKEVQTCLWLAQEHLQINTAFHTLIVHINTHTTTCRKYYMVFKDSENSCSKALQKWNENVTCMLSKAISIMTTHNKHSWFASCLRVFLQCRASDMSEQPTASRVLKIFPFRDS